MKRKNKKERKKVGGCMNDLPHSTIGLVDEYFFLPRDWQKSPIKKVDKEIVWDRKGCE